MPKLTTLKSGLQRLGGRISALPNTRNPEAEQRTRGRKWMTIRARWFREHPLCVACEAVGKVSAATRLDHVIPLIDGGKDDESNLQSLCIACHDAKTAEEAKARGRG